MRKAQLSSGRSLGLAALLATFGLGPEPDEKVSGLANFPRRRRVSSGRTKGYYGPRDPDARRRRPEAGRAIRTWRQVKTALAYLHASLKRGPMETAPAGTARPPKFISIGLEPLDVR